MIKCPNCGSSAQVRIDDRRRETFVWKDIVSVYLGYICGCGCKFVTRLQVSRDKEEVVDKDERGK